MNKFVAAAVALVVTGSAGAGVTMNSVMGPFAVQLTDLDSTDGIQPALTFSGGQSFGAVGATPPFSFNSHVASSHAVYLPAAIDLSVSPMLASVGFDGQGTLRGASMNANARTSLSDGSTTGFSVYAFTAESGTFMLSAHTQLQVISKASASVQGFFATGQPFDRNFSSAVRIQISGNGGLNGGWEDVNDALNIDVGRALSTFDARGERLLTATFSNQTDKDVLVTVQSSVAVNGNVSPVPEPATHALVGFGAALIGLVARRRLKRQSVMVDNREHLGDPS
jgi:hypothetical protein